MSIIPQLERDLYNAARQQLSGPDAPHARRPPVRLRHLGYVAAAAVVIAVVGVFIGIRGHNPAVPASGGAGRILFRASPRDPSSPLGPALDRATALLRARVASVFPGAQVRRSAAGVVVTVPHATPSARRQVVALAVPGELEFYDWEANSLLPDGATVASRLGSRNADAIAISQGNGGWPGSSGAGSMPLYDAVQLASRQPAEPASVNARPWAQYYLFGAPGSSACARTGNASGAHCLLAGPAGSTQALLGSFPPGVSRAQTQILAVPQGIAVLEAAPASFGHAPSLSSASARFYVVRDHAALLSNDITRPQETNGPSGDPLVSFGFTVDGQRMFHAVTAAIARRGAVVSGPAMTLDQHFAVGLDDQLITVPLIDYRVYPNGLPGDPGADIAGGFTSRSAEILAAILRSGPLPVNLTPRG